MQWIPQVVFVLLLGAAVWLFTKNIRFIRRNINLGGPAATPADKNLAWRNVLLLAFGQKKMFKKPLVALMHLVVYAGFIIINIEVLEILLDGLLGIHRLFSGLGALYTFLINAFEILALLVIIACAIFLVRRNIIRVWRVSNKDLNGWPRSDANIILITEIILMGLFLKMNAAEATLMARGVAPFAEHGAGPFIISGMLVPVMDNFSSSTLLFTERAAWWLHIAGILAFLNYLPYSKHLHILFAFPNAYYTRTKPMGEMENMPVVQKEVVLAMGGDQAAYPALAGLPENPPEKFGAKDVMDLDWHNILDSYTCTECGRCSAACPANITGKKLSPRTIMMKTRDRAEEAGKNRDANNGLFKEDGKSLLHDYITVEELRACTTCNACVEACPVSISPLDIILKLRRHLILDESNSPAEWNAMFGNIENNFAPWKFNPDERTAWINS